MFKVMVITELNKSSVFVPNAAGNAALANAIYSNTD